MQNIDGVDSTVAARAVIGSLAGAEPMTNCIKPIRISVDDTVIGLKFTKALRQLYTFLKE